MRVLKTVEEKILDKVLYLIGKNGTSKISVRDIAREAEVNVSAINYYFNNKENMFYQLEEFLVNNFKDVFSPYDNKEYNDEQKLLYWADGVIESLIKYPGIPIILKEKALEAKSSTLKDFLIAYGIEADRKMNQSINNIIKDKNKFEYAKMVFTSSVVSPATLGMSIPGGIPFIVDREKRKEYIAYIIELISKQ